MKVIEVLEESAARLAYAATNVASARAQLDTCKLLREEAMADATLKNKDAKNQRILDAHIKLDPMVKKANENVIDAQSYYDARKIEFDEIENRFISARKLAGMDEKELQAISGSTIKTREDSMSKP